MPEVLRLRTLGAAYIATADGQPLGGAASQRRTLALLALLAVSGDGGLSRDKLVGLLWPESSSDRARHSLTQALYAARRALGTDDLFLADSDVRLNPERLSTDVAEFEAALDRGELERAVALYGGAFLDGFFLAGSTEFEQWRAAQRARLEARAADALGMLGDRAEADGAQRAAIEWRRRLAALRLFDAAAALGLMRVLARGGDRAGAIEHARLHSLLLREELGLEPDQAVTDFAQRLRGGDSLDFGDDRSPSRREEAPESDPGAGAFPEPMAPHPAAPERSTAAPVSKSGAPRPPSADVPSVAAGGRPDHAARWRQHAAWLAVTALAVVALALTLGRPGSRDRTPPATAQLAQKVVVAPFRVAGASDALSYLRDGMVELLSARLADDTAARSVDAGAVLAAWRSAGLAGTVEVPRDTVVRLARSLGAERVVVGSVVGTPSRAVLSANVVTVATGAVSGQATVEGPTDSLSTLVDRLAARLLLLDAGEDASLASRTTGSLPALRAFLDGQAAWSRSEYTRAQRSFERALQLDSGFALAAVQLARTAERAWTAAPRARATALAWRDRDALSDRVGALLVAVVGPRFPAPSRAADVVASWDRLIDLTPDRADTWYEVGARAFHDGAIVGMPAPHTRARAALQRALTLDSGYVAARVLLAHLDALAPQTTTRAFAGEDTGPLTPFTRWRTAVARRDARALRKLRDTLSNLGPVNLRAIALSSQYDAVSLADGDGAVRALRARATRTSDRLEVALAEHSLALNEGRLRDALAATDRVGALQPASHADLRLRVLDALYGSGSAQAAADAAARLDAEVGSGPSSAGDPRGVRLADACVIGQWRLARGDSTAVRGIVDQLRAGSQTVPQVAVAAAPAACAELLEAALAVTTRAADAAERVARVDSLAFTAAASGDASTYAPLLLARLHEQLGDVQGALRAIRRRAYMSEWPRYLAVALREESRYAAAVGATDVFRDAGSRYLALRAAPDSALHPEVDAVRRSVVLPPVEAIR